MTFLFEFPLAALLFIISFYCFSYFPKRIEVIINKEHISKNRLFSSITYSVVILFSIAWSIYYISEYGFYTLFSLLIIVFVVFFVSLTGYSQFLIRFRDNKKVFTKKIYYGLEGVSEEIDKINKEYPEVTIKKSVAKSPVWISIISNDKTRVNQLTELIDNNTKIFKDLDQPKYRRLLYTYIVLFTLATLYVISLGIVQFIL